jgi:Flp pilus assembly protein TadG
LWRDESGIVAVYMTVCLPGFVGLLILVADGSHALSTRHMLQVTADAAALAAASDPTSNSYKTIAQTFAQMNMPTNTYGTVLASGDVNAGYWPPGVCTTAGSCFQTPCKPAPTSTPCNAVKVTTRYTPNLVFYQALGWNGPRASATAIATFGTGNGPSLPTWDAVIAQDISSSFQNSIKNAQQADQQLITCVSQNASSSSQLGLGLFTSYSTDRPTLTPLINPTSGIDNTQTLKNDAGTFGDCGSRGMPVCSGTNIAAGINDGIAQFTSSSYKKCVTAGSQQNIIIVTDGEPNSCGKNNSCSTSQAEAEATAAANTAWADKINVSTIYFCSSGCTKSAQNYLASLKRGNGFSLVAPTANEIATAMQAGCSQSLAQTATRLVW